MFLSAMVGAHTGATYSGTGLTMAWKVVRSFSLLWPQEVPDSAFIMLTRPLALAAEFL